MQCVSTVLHALMSMIKCDIKMFNLFTYDKANINVAILSTPFLHRNVLNTCNLSLITAVVNLSSSESWVESKTGWISRWVYAIICVRAETVDYPGIKVWRCGFPWYRRMTHRDVYLVAALPLQIALYAVDFWKACIAVLKCTATLKALLLQGFSGAWFSLLTIDTSCSLIITIYHWSLLI